PDMKLTPAQIREMMQSGQIGGPGASAMPVAPGRSGGPSAAGQRPPRPAGPAGSLTTPPVGTDVEEDERKSGKGGRVGGAADRAGRRKARAERATERGTRVSSPVDARAILSGDDEDSRRNRGPRRHRANARGATIAPRKTHV